MAQLPGLSPIDPYGTRLAGHPAKTFLRRNVGGGSALGVWGRGDVRVVRPRRVRTAYRPALASLEPVMPHRRTSPLFAAAATAAATAAMLALAAPAASAAPIPLPHHFSEDSVIGAGHHAPGGLHTPDGHHDPDGHHVPDGHPAPTAPEGRDDAPSGRDDAPYGRIDRGVPAGRTGAGARDQGVHDQDVHHDVLFPRTSGDHLTVTVRDSGSARTDGTFELYCHAGKGSTHRDARRACDKLDHMTRWGQDPFAPVPQNAQCTMMYGGPATAHVTGTWAGRPVNADFRRTNGCEISRWSRFEPLLPSTTS